MNVTTIDMDQNTAREAFLDYRRSVKERHNAEDEQIMRGYRELARGRRLIMLDQVIEEAGFDGRGLPKLAVARATDERTIVSVRKTSSQWGRPADGTDIVFSPRGNPRFDANQRSGVIRISVNRTPETTTMPRPWSWQALTPVVPPALRPSRFTSKHYILWEPEWFVRTVRTPHDPFLLRHISGHLYAILAAWDLTDIERAVMARRGA